VRAAAVVAVMYVCMFFIVALACVPVPAPPPTFATDHHSHTHTHSHTHRLSALTKNALSWQELQEVEETKRRDRIERRKQEVG
jgi:hypothetical protein